MKGAKGEEGRVGEGKGREKERGGRRRGGVGERRGKKGGKSLKEKIQSFIRNLRSHKPSLLLYSIGHTD